MAVSDFLPFATGSGANVLSQIDFVADPLTVTGYAAGQVKSAKVNKLWRQSSFVSAAVAQVIVEQLNVDVLDNGDLNALAANLTLAIAHLGTGGSGGSSGGIPEAPVDSNIYGRGNLTWTAVVPAVGGTMTGALSIRAVSTAPALNVSRNSGVPLAPPSDSVARFVGTDAIVARVVVDAFAQNPELSLRRANGTATSPTTIQNNNTLALVGAYGRGSTAYSAAARASVEFLAAENWTDAAQGTTIRLNVTPPGGTTPVAGLIVGSTGVTLVAPLTVPNGGTGVNNFTVPPIFSLEGILVKSNGINPLAPLYSNTTGVIGHWGNCEIACVSVAVGEAGIDFARANGTLSALTAVRNNDFIGTIWFEGYGATKWNTAPRGQISCIATQNWTDTAQGTTLYFYTTPNNSIVTQLSMRLDSTGLYLATPLSVGSGGTGVNNFPVNTNSRYVLNGAFLMGQGTNPIAPASDLTGTIGTIKNTGATLFMISGGYQSYITFAHSGGSLAAPSATQYSDPLGVIYFEGYGSTKWNTAARGLLVCRPNETWTDTAQGTAFDFYATNNGTTTTTAIFSIDGIKAQLAAGKHLYFLGASGGSLLDIFDDGNSHIETSIQLWINGNTHNDITMGGTTFFKRQALFDSNDGIYMTSAPGGDAKAWYNAYGARVWSAGALADQNWWIRDESAGVGRFIIDIGGNCYNNTGSWVVGSDRRFKKEIADLPIGLDELRKLRPVRYKHDGPAGTLMSEDGVQRFGLIADEVKKVLPDIVHTAEFDQLGKIDTIDPGPLLYIMLNAIRELSAKVDELSGKD